MQESSRINYALLIPMIHDVVYTKIFQMILRSGSMISFTRFPQSHNSLHYISEFGKLCLLIDRTRKKINNTQCYQFISISVTAEKFGFISLKL